MVYVEFGTQNDRFCRKIESSNRVNGLEYSVTINTPQVKKFDFSIYCSECPFEASHDFLAMAMIELSKKSADCSDFSVDYQGETYAFKLNE